MNLIVTGRVQGVGFRYFTRLAAKRLGVVGWVRNKPDGSVEIQAWADEETFASFLAEIKRGPRFGRVDQIALTKLDLPANYEEFDVTY